MNAPSNTYSGPIAWFARNPVAANLLMLAILILGIASTFTIRKQLFPIEESNWIGVTINYHGASPKEVEESITIKLEEALDRVQGIERYITRSVRSNVSAEIKVMSSYELRDVLDEIKSAIDSISSFPEDIERPAISQTRFRQDVMWINLTGDLPWSELKQFGEVVENELRSLPGVNIVDYHTGLNYEIAIEVSRDKINDFNLSFEEIAEAVRQFSTNRSAGEIHTKDGYISVRVEEQAYREKDFENIPIRTIENGTTLTLKDVAHIKDGFEEGLQYSKLDGVNSVFLFVGATPDQSITEVSKTLNDYIKQKQAHLPTGLRLEAWIDTSYYLDGRINMMLGNMFYGAVLVFLILGLFLRLELTFWVMLGLPISIFGAMSLLQLPWIDITINAASLFAFIMVLGIVVDDAIIIGESVQSEIESSGQKLENVIRGARRVAVPATFGVLTTVAAFLPLALDSGPQSVLSNSIGYVVIFCLIFSMIESKLILPAHLALMKPEPIGKKNPLGKLRERTNHLLNQLIEILYLPFIKIAIRYRYTVLSIFLGALIVTISLFTSGNMRFFASPKIPNDYSTITIQMLNEASEQETLLAAQAVESMINTVSDAIEKEFGNSMVDKYYVEILSRTSIEIQVRLVAPESRPIDTFDLSARWRNALPEIPGVKQISITDDVYSGDSNDGDIAYSITSTDEKQLHKVALDLKQTLQQFAGVGEIGDSEESPLPELVLKLKPTAYSLGLTIADVAMQSANSLYGLEVQRIVRDRQELRVMLRYLKEERHSLDSVATVLIRTPTGSQVPLSEIAEINIAPGTQQIYRENGKRTINIWANVDNKIVEPQKIADQIFTKQLPNILAANRSVTVNEAGRIKEGRMNTEKQLIKIVLALVIIYTLLAIPLKSYLQPLLIICVIPFGFVGAVLGHKLLNIDFSSISIFGLFAVAGVAVNDALVLVDYINSTKVRGGQIVASILHACTNRFRAIVLTSLTTFFGLLPIIYETSLQAKIIIPMAVSLAFGILFSTIVTLILVPCLFMTLEDLKSKLISATSSIAESNA